MIIIYNYINNNNDNNYYYFCCCFHQKFKLAYGNSDRDRDDVEVDKNIQFCMSMRGKTVLDGNEISLIESFHFEEMYEELVATVARLTEVKCPKSKTFSR